MNCRRVKAKWDDSEGEGERRWEEEGKKKRKGSQGEEKEWEKKWGWDGKENGSRKEFFFRCDKYFWVKSNILILADKFFKSWA